LTSSFAAAQPARKRQSSPIDNNRMVSPSHVFINKKWRVLQSPRPRQAYVAIYTLHGECGSVRVAARIVGGRVYSEDQSYQASGGVGANGVIRVTVAGFGRSASGTGRLSHNSGAGRWWSSRGECSGSWSASRRGAITESGGHSRAPPHDPASIDLSEGPALSLSFYDGHLSARWT